MQNQAETLLINERRLWHRLPFGERAQQPVGSECTWESNAWQFDRKVAGNSDKTIHWDIPLYDGSRLTDHKWRSLLEEFKALVWSIFHENATGRPPKVGTLGPITIGVYALAKFLTEERISTVGEIDYDVVEHYSEWLIESMVTDDPDSQVTVGQLTTRLTIIQWIERQSYVLRDSGWDFPCRQLLDVPVERKAKQISGKAVGRIPPLPDEIALELINQADRLLWSPAEDVVRLQKELLTLREMNAGRFCNSHAQTHINRHLMAFRFSTCEGEETPWHPPFIAGQSGRPLHNQVRAAVLTIRDACVIIIQATTGLRISELCGLEVGPKKGSQSVPSCVQYREGPSGLSELAYLSGYVFKGRAGWESCEWIVGARPKGAEARPVALRAIWVLEQLFAPWRELGESNALIVGFNSPKGLPRGRDSIRPILGSTLNDGLKRFARKYVHWSALPSTGANGQSMSKYISAKGENIRSHQWRKHFAMFVFRTDSRMTAAIARHFKHLQLAIVDGCYIGNDIKLLEEIGSEANRQTATFLYEVSVGVRPVEGTGAELVERNRELVERNLGNTRESSIRKIASACRAERFKIFFAEHGKCLISLSPTESRCHELAGTKSWANRRPNHVTRSCAVCMACPCFAIDSEHVGFWRDRYLNNSRAYALAKQEGRESEYWVARERLRQSASVLRRIAPALHEELSGMGNDG